MKRGLAGFWYRFKKRFRYYVGPGEPITFVRGSEAEMERLTTLFCHASPDLFNEHPHGVLCAYWSASDSEPAQTYSHPQSRTPFSQPQKAHLQAWQELVFTHNEFRGTYWRGSNNFRPPSYWKYSKCPRRIREWIRFWENLKKPVVVEGSAGLDFIVPPPSAHERAEALLFLSKWLDGKVSEERKRELLCLCD